MKKRYLLSLLFLLLIVLILPSVTALSLNGNKLGTIIYEPGKIITNHYAIADTNQEVEVSVGGELTEYLSVSEVVNNEFDLIINFPEEIIPLGSYSFGLSVTEISDEESGGLGALVSVSKTFQVEVYSYEKEIGVSFNSPSVNEGNPVNFQLGVQSKCYQDIDSVKGEITVYDFQNKELGKLKTEEISLKSLDSQTFIAAFDTLGLPAGSYWAKAIVYYDGQQKIVNNTFKIGNMDLVLKNYTSELKQGFSEFKVNVVNNWGNELRNVYAKLLINNQELLQTPNINLAPWKEGELKGILKVDLELGEYEGILQLFFESEMREEPIKIVVIEKTEEIIEELEKSRNLALILMIKIGRAHV